MCPLVNGKRIPSDSSSLGSVESERWTAQVQFEKSVAYVSNMSTGDVRIGLLGSMPSKEERRLC